MLHEPPPPRAFRRPRSLVAIGAAAAVVVGLLAVPLSAGAAQSDVTAQRLETNAGPDPLGLDDATPTLSWILATAQRGIFQKQYRLVVSSTPAKAAAGQGDIWDSGIVASDATSVDYAGPALSSRTRYYWSVKTWAPTESSWAEPAWFETA